MAGVECVWVVEPSLGWRGLDILWLWIAETIGLGLIGVVGMEILGWAELLGPKDLLSQQRWFALVGWSASALFAGLLSAAQAPFAVETAGVGGSDILLITLDTTRADALGLYGNTLAKTPVLDKLGREGVVFNQALATAPQTGPSHLSILSGKYPYQTGVYSNATPVGSVGMIAERLLSQGWGTGAFVSGYPLKSRFGFQAGFGHYDALFDPHVGWLTGPLVRTLIGGAARERRGDRTVARAVDWLGAQEGPVFCWLHLYDPHGPYKAPGGLHGTYASLEGGSQLPAKKLPSYWNFGAEETVDSGALIARYLEEITWMDRQIGVFLEAARARRPSSTPLIIVVADHGESYLEHGVLFDHGDDLYEPAMRIPMILSGGGFPRGARSDCLVSTVDILPTIAEAFGLEGAKGPGLPLKSALGGLEDCREREVFGSTVGSREVRPPIHHMIRSGQGKYIRYGENDGVFFDLIRDPAEEEAKLVSGTMHDAFLRRELERRLAQGGVRLDREEVPEVLQQLEQLGYVDKP